MSNDINVAVVLGLLTVNLAAAFFSISLHHHNLHAENHLLENVQAACLGVSTLGHLLSIRTSQYQRVLSLAVALLCFSFLLRELDFERLNVPPLVQITGSGQGRLYLLASLWVLLMSYALISIDSKVQFLERLVCSRIFLYLCAAFGLLIVSALMDKNVFGLTHSRLFEELLEANAYLLIMLSLFGRTADSHSRKVLFLSRSI